MTREIEVAGWTVELGMGKHTYRARRFDLDVEFDAVDPLMTDDQLREVEFAIADARKAMVVQNIDRLQIGGPP